MNGAARYITVAITENIDEPKAISRNGITRCTEHQLQCTEKHRPKHRSCGPDSASRTQSNAEFRPPRS